MRKSKSPTIADVLERLHEATKELERLGYEDSDVEGPPASETQLLKIAKSLAFIWASRKVFLGDEIVADPGWLILLHLKIAELSQERIQISTLCIDSGAPATTGLRWIRLLESKSMLRITPDRFDGRKKHVSLTEDASQLMTQYLHNVQKFISTRGILF